MTSTPTLQNISLKIHDNGRDHDRPPIVQALLDSICLSSTLSSGRPLLTHLNADTTWLLSLPRPVSEHSTPIRERSRVFYHVLIDPWLRGGQSDVAKFFSQQWHAQESVMQSIREVEDLIKDVEVMAAERSSTEGTAGLNPGRSECEQEDRYEEDMDNESYIDAVVISHEFTDHMHKETLLEINPRVPVFATTKAASVIRSWKHSDFVAEIPRFMGDWRASSIDPLPKWLGVSRVAYAGSDMLYYHSAIMIAFTILENETEQRTEAEAIIYTPHGVSPDDVAPVAKAEPSIKTLALLHGLQDIYISRPIGAQLNKGAHNGLKIQRLLDAKHWIATHDEVKKGGEIVSWFLRRRILTLQEAVEREKLDKGKELKGGELEAMAEVRFRELGNGESLILE
ncbi:Uncharacterized protein BP5553_02329 [Venustampulla echinocandica]|uniref:Metallo-beta-lactamase domain-containing protein n=1 Tax=Venustampulla echinocandica TaxID=2656787 RepID=A0A370U3J5_9HELO|nr:Uncharacterized protein BP5553_02329 [Venustampulla echinocandica]RDL42350.1 Uncharacterized protein BP5553_02329 [Venustampulla echinocandica]